MAKQQVPWSVKGVSPEARRIAKERAQAKGLTIGEWVSEAIHHRAHPPQLVMDDQAQASENSDPAVQRAQEIIQPLEDVLGVMIDRIAKLERRS